MRDRIFVAAGRIQEEDPKKLLPGPWQEALSQLGRKLLSGILREAYQLEDLGEIAKSSLGKPYLVRCPDIHFNISHSGNWAVCAAGPVELGIDIQYHRNARFGKLAEKILNEEEWAAYRTAEDPIRCFYDIWTRKESYLKYTGEGIRRDLRRLRYRETRFVTFSGLREYSVTLCIPGGWKGIIETGGLPFAERTVID